jgi:hypothetical protein
MPILNGIYSALVFCLKLATKTLIAIAHAPESRKLAKFSDFIKKGSNSRQTWDLFLSSFIFWAPSYLRGHRRFFSKSGRGFGEESFHAMWLSLFKEYRFKNCLEIGVYRGQVISLWALLHRNLNIKGSVLGISPLDDTGDAYSKYSKLDYAADIKHNFLHFDLPDPEIIPFTSQAPGAESALSGKLFDLIYVDGSHDYEDVAFDVRLARKHLTEGGILVLDDAGLFLGYKARFFSFSGHEGPSLVAKDLNGKGFTLLGICGHNVVFQKS